MGNTALCSTYRDINQSKTALPLFCVLLLFRANFTHDVPPFHVTGAEYNKIQRDCDTTSAVVINFIVDFLKTGPDFSSTSSVTNKYVRIKNICPRTHSHTHTYTIYEN